MKETRCKHHVGFRLRCPQAGTQLRLSRQKAQAAKESLWIAVSLCARHARLNDYMAAKPGDAD